MQRTKLLFVLELFFFFLLGLILSGVHHEEKKCMFFSIPYLLFATLSIRI